MNRAGSPATDDPGSRRRPWRLIFGDGSDRPDSSAAITPLDGATNMAMDVALLESVKAGGAPVLRLYRWDPACLSFGRNQPARGRYDVAAAADRGIDLVRRPTGGQAVLHDLELTYAVIAPVDGIGKPRAAYRRINEALVHGLTRLGVRAALAGSGGLGGGGELAEGAPEYAGSRAGQPSGGAKSGPDWDAACFRRPERGEVVVGGAKLVGSAQRMESRTILQHGSILVGGTQAPAEELLVESGGRGVGTPPTPSPGTHPTATSGRDTAWTTLERELGERPEFGAIAAAVRAGFADVFGVELEPDGLSPAERAVVVEARARFASAEWTWRR